MTNYCYACRVHLEKNIDDEDIKIKLCQDCFYDKSNILINKTQSKRKFFLNDTDLEDLPNNKINNNFGKKTILYYYDDIMNKSYKKYGISGLIDKRLKITNKNKMFHKRNKANENYQIILAKTR